MSRVIPEGLQGNTWFALHHHKGAAFVRYVRKGIHRNNGYFLVQEKNQKNRNF